jgi:hypothetical protein
MALTPLGWSEGRPLFLDADAAQTGIYSVGARQTRFIDTLMSQPIVTAELSPAGRFIAFGAPTSCGYCTLNVYDLERGYVWIGETGMPNETTIAWTADGSALVAIMNGHLAAISVITSQTRLFPLPPGLPGYWTDPMQAIVRPHAVTLVDTVTHRTYQSRDYSTQR